MLFWTGEEFLVGEAAERRGAADPKHVVREFKRRLGDQVPFLLDGSPFSAELLTARLLQWVVASTAKQVGGPYDRLTVTHPVNWGDFKMNVFGQVMALADVHDVHCVAEPVAAAAQYASRSRIDTGSKLAMYDFGGGTFDICVVEKTPRGFEILGYPQGIEDIGGTDLDDCMLELVKESLGDRLDDIDPNDPDTEIGLGRLRRDCVEAKESLSTDVDTIVPVSLPGLSRTVRVTRREFETRIRPPVDVTLAAMQRALASASVQPADLAAVVLVGGSSRIPLIGELIQHEFGVPLALDTHPKHDVALGAVRLAGTPHPLRQIATSPTGDACPDRPASARGDDPRAGTNPLATSRSTTPRGARASTSPVTPAYRRRSRDRRSSGRSNEELRPDPLCDPALTVARHRPESRPCIGPRVSEAPDHAATRSRKLLALVAARRSDSLGRRGRGRAVP